MSEAGGELIRFEGTRQTKGPGPAARAISSSRARDAGVSALNLGFYDVEEMNTEFALVIIGKGPVIYWNRPGAETEEELRLITLDAFRVLSENARHEYEDEKGKTRSISYANKWLADPDRREFAGIEFFPNPDGKVGRSRFLNLWRGFPLKPSEQGSYGIFADHMLTNVCNGDHALYRWLFAWFAQILQEPRRKPGTSVVLRGGMGVGKSIVGETFGSLLSPHYVLADDARYLTGNFNSHMASCLLLQADEAVWAGDKAAEGRLKGLITSTSQMIEAKGVDPVRIDNHLRVLMTSNNDWVVPAGKDERRFAIFDVAGYSAQNHGFFGELVAELDAGGRRKLLHDLLTFDLSTVNLREIPKTDALLEQKIHSLDPIDAWWLDRLQAGSPTRGGESWPDFVLTKSLVDDFIAAAEKLGARRRASETQFGKRLAKIAPGVRRVQRTVQVGETSAAKRQYVYDLPALASVREAFETALGQPIFWECSDEPLEPPQDG